jgi:hypothetical protein
MKSFFKKHIALVLLIQLVSISAFCQNTFYIPFNITGPTVVCADGTTIYTYSGVTNAYWTVSGGTIVGGLLGLRTLCK